MAAAISAPKMGKEGKGCVTRFGVNGMISDFPRIEQSESTAQESAGSGRRGISEAAAGVEVDPHPWLG